MKDKLLLVVEDHFDIPGRGLAVAPSLPIRRGQAFPFEADVDIVPPAGYRRPAIALFSVPMGGRSSKSACLLMLRHVSKVEVPIGSRIFANGATAARFSC